LYDIYLVREEFALPVLELGRRHVHALKRHYHQAVRPCEIMVAVSRMCSNLIQSRLGSMEGNFARRPALHDEIILGRGLRAALPDLESFANPQLP
jgi:hypothetical protein